MYGTQPGLSDSTLSIRSVEDCSMHQVWIQQMYISPVSDTKRNLRNLQCLAVECELQPGGGTENKSGSKVTPEKIREGFC